MPLRAMLMCRLTPAAPPPQTRRALVFINPGNPSGQCLPPEAVTRLVQWCASHRVVLLADEVYQELVYNPDK